MEILLGWFVAGLEDPVTRGRAAVFCIAAAALIAAVLFLILFWRWTRDLERQTLYVSLGTVLLLAALMLVARAGHPEWASGVVAALILAFCVRDLWEYGTASQGGSAMTIPILLAAFGIGPGAGALAAGIGIAAAWISALRRNTPRLAAPGMPARDRWAFHAPALTVILALTALLAELGGRGAPNP